MQRRERSFILVKGREGKGLIYNLLTSLSEQSRVNQELQFGLILLLLLPSTFLQYSQFQGAIAKKRKRAATKDIAGISLEDIVKYFDLPIVEASRNLRIGLTVLKRKCRELGIPRWPHRKIKSLDSLIHNLQEEAVRQEQESEDAARAVAKRKKMLEREKENIERKPFMEIQSETKKFRQDVFKRRHRARSLQSQGNLGSHVGHCQYANYAN
ncbi:protein RKD5 [Tripterygium wilfordii]|uniref:protein RKD5 n=1 Tax=Tripterygium wilfordii TaxID=458696 RepID=UPI0018F821D9|nr:protein RKD5 [Tripterygium wilfordii]